MSSELAEALLILAESHLVSGSGLPGAAELDMPALLDHGLSLRSDLRPDVLRGLRMAIDSGSLADAWPHLRERDPEAYGALRTLVLGSYFASPQVMAAFGYPGSAGTPVDPEKPLDFDKTGLLAPVLARGPVWRPAE